VTLRVEPTADVTACVALRRAVFIAEQGVPEAVEQDGRDGAAHHILARLDGVPVGCARILTDGETGRIGRVCVLVPHRGRGIGEALVRACLDHLRTLPGVKRAELAALVTALGLYEKLGFTPIGPRFPDGGGLPHQAMELAL